MTVTLKASTFSFLVINDTEQFEVPMIHMNITSTKADVIMETGQDDAASFYLKLIGVIKEWPHMNVNAML